MSTKLLLRSFAPLAYRRQFSTSRLLSLKIDSHFLSQITAAESTLSNTPEPTKRGPTARAQAHVGQDLSASVIRDIFEGEKMITGSDEPVKGGPASLAQSLLTSTSSTSSNSNSAQSATSASSNNTTHTGKLDSHTLSEITQAEKQLSGEEGPVKGGPTARAQQHVGESISSEILSEITEGEKKITGGERVKGGPTSRAQSELGKSRSS
ncbi:hypothetical protein N0V83_010945 [Neocucurbitaria cava]|uniref:Uncharacterized protein n=1 Tax=Neocucurbitaria cava TaxID=798079 RepID=A0A9W8Y0C1_9PLEO|nr:hypothetical protein N0V83_010945 [Neocucurbitaria cava]